MKLSTPVIIAAASALEVATGGVLIAAPSLFSWLLFGVTMTLGGQALGRISGVALLALAMACWPRGGTAEAPVAARSALLLFSALTAAYLLYLGFAGQLIGVLLWPAAVTHLVFAILLARNWRRLSRCRADGVSSDRLDRRAGPRATEEL
jgi:hypothetical protein